MAKTCWIHVGAHKTASSLLQRHLALNAGALQAAGVSHVRTDPDFNGVFIPKYYKLLADSSRAGAPIDEGAGFGELREILRSAVDAAPGPDVVLSNERFAGRMLGHAEKLYPEGRYVSQFFALVLEDYSPRFIIYIRRQDNFLESCYHQYFREEDPRIDFDAFLARCDPSSLSWASFVGELERTVGQERVFVRPYEAIHAGAEDFVQDFFALFRPALPLTFEPVTLNPRLSRPAMRIARLLYPRLPASARYRAQKWLHRLLPAGKFGAPRLLSEERRRDLARAYRDSNLKLLGAYAGNRAMEYYSAR